MVGQVAILHDAVGCRLRRHPPGDHRRRRVVVHDLEVYPVRPRPIPAAVAAILVATPAVLVVVRLRV
eukprot:scaffold498447_cov42-Prasinocladus_malaysianus.AAC.1